MSQAVIRLFAVLADDDEGILEIISTNIHGSYTALTPDCPQAHWFEREIFEQWGIVPEGHPWLKPIRFHKTYNRNEESNNLFGTIDWHHRFFPSGRFGSS